MTGAVSVLLVETDELELRERSEQLLLDGYAVDSVSTVDQARVRLAEGPDALMLSSGPETIGLLRELRAGEIPRADDRVPVLVVGVDMTRQPCATTAPVRTSRCRRRAQGYWWRRGLRRSADVLVRRRRGSCGWGA
jgi:hypothetical protein